MASRVQQKRMLTNERSRLGKADLATVLRKAGAWTALPLEARQRLYAMLPEPRAGEAAHDFEVNPMITRYREHIETELGRWKEDLKNGLETKKWRDTAMQAGCDRKEGKFDGWKEEQREQWWGGRKDSDAENAEPKKANGDAEAEEGDGET